VEEFVFVLITVMEKIGRKKRQCYSYLGCLPPKSNLPPNLKIQTKENVQIIARLGNLFVIRHIKLLFLVEICKFELVVKFWLWWRRKGEKKCHDGRRFSNPSSSFLCYKGGVTHFRQLVTEPQFERIVLLSSLRNVLSS
jgi:hypothetical protein